VLKGKNQTIMKQTYKYSNETQLVGFESIR